MTTGSTYTTILPIILRRLSILFCAMNDLVLSTFLIKYLRRKHAYEFMFSDIIHHQEVQILDVGCLVGMNCL